MSGEDQLAMSNDFIKVLHDNPAVYYLGFGRFMSGSLTPIQFASLDLRSLNLLVALCRCINDTSFRRQTKGDSHMPIALAVTLDTHTHQQTNESIFKCHLQISYKTIPRACMCTRYIIRPELFHLPHQNIYIS